MTSESGVYAMLEVAGEMEQYFRDEFPQEDRDVWLDALDENQVQGEELAHPDTLRHIRAIIQNWDYADFRAKNAYAVWVDMRFRE